MTTLTTFHLHGALGRKFGKVWNLHVNSVKEGLRAIDINLKGALSNYWINKGRDKKYKVKLDDYAISDEKEIIGPMGNTKIIHIVPLIKGSDNAFGKILTGVAMIGLMFATGGLSTAGFAGWAKAGLGYVIGMTTVGMGASLILGGVVQLLTPVPNFNQDAGNDSKSSTVFSGNSINQAQGGSVGIVYGTMMISPMPIAISLSNSDVEITTDIPENNVEERILLGGGIQYNSVVK